MNQEEKLLIKANKNGDGYITPQQSADTLFHFVGELEHLTSILKNDALIPRYCMENVDYLQIPHKCIAYPMICFCDINLHKIHEHVKFYGGYGIAFSKIWGINRGIQPVQYVNNCSALCKDFSEAFRMAEGSTYTDKAHDFLLSQMCFLKPIEGNMERKSKSIHKNFTDECEWRFVPGVSSEELPQVLVDDDVVRKELFSKSLIEAKNVWLNFLFDDIKYIIVKNREDADKIIKIIIAKRNIKRFEKYSLISKIFIWDEMKGDF